MTTRVHFIGICGTAMATLAALLKRRGFDVRGSDQSVYPPMSDFLAAEHIPITTGYAAEHIGSDFDLLAAQRITIWRERDPQLFALPHRKRFCDIPRVAISKEMLRNPRH